jgi:hypothetical protein
MLDHQRRRRSERDHSVVSELCLFGQIERI